MADPLSASVVLRVLKREGCTVVEHDGWRTHNRNGRGPWGPVHGVMLHHTASGDGQGIIDVCRRGRPDLPGPLCHGVIDKRGRVHLIGHGRTNHAGLGDDDVLRAVIAERSLPDENELNTDGNARFYGFECVNRGDGDDPWPDVQLDAIERAAAALCRAHGWGARSVLGHAEWSPQKIDPRGFSMGGMRGRIGDRLGDKAPRPALPKPTLPVVDLSRLRTAAKTDPPKKGTPTSYGSGVRTVEAALVDAGLLRKAHLDGHFGTSTVAAYAAWQRRCGYSGPDADGIPGRATLARLGDAAGFRVVA
ncbi:N-acetylmuramoyl-L-alanine amidase [Streptomyces sp. WAC 06738]|uniref:N-acetylmuramoyl-L-alanine amidase n=1 Tax=Streptomyces sp. WAC 06738 TaxID=2203210 RepID=UPI000F71C08B|nr:N-acetylmuramoyl-L-alanine amidase [Streptomyces sp. WAC 06738]AZM46561.1 N-acetylmuramoyl-L-alanine amidase [Streptomyces sp. WAC 06738]